MSQHIVCPHCHSTNRVPKDKLDGSAELSCGKCHQPLFDQHPAALSTAGLNAQIAKSDVPVVVDFSGCPGDTPQAKFPNWVTCPWPPEYLDILNWQLK